MTSPAPHTVSDVMTPTAVAVGPRAAYKEMVELMRQWSISALPVLAGEGRVIGVVSEADLLLKEEYRDEEPELSAPGSQAFDEAAKAAAQYAEDLMTTPAVTVHPDATISEAARTMARLHIKRLPVTDEAGLLQGVVSRGDLLKVFLRTDEEIAAELRETVLPELPPSARAEVSVQDGVVTLAGQAQGAALIPLVTRAVRSVEGVVDVRFEPGAREGGHQGCGKAS
ncbi:CBS domain-containing protein [Streptomyces sp. TS71-3]|uniref:CBS domain-containing protein n=1 Tax=Streptomyces sp. TS71-3 TaxID=2733862 RepID=UPI001BB3E7CD|nr:CBS domain-containing protein [Streptomyces sp. TS71-3]